MGKPSGQPTSGEALWNQLVNQGVGSVNDNVGMCMVEKQIWSHPSGPFPKPPTGGAEKTAETVKAGLKKAKTTSSGAKIVQYAFEYGLALETVRAQHQMHGELKALEKAVRRLAKIAKTQGGDVGPKAAQELPRLQKVYLTAKAAYEEQQSAVRAANRFLQEYNKVKHSVGRVSGAAATKLTDSLKGLAPHATKLRTAMQGTKAGRMAMRAGRVVAHPAFKKAMVVFAAVTEGIISYLDSPAATSGGKVATGVTGAAAGALPMLNLPVAVADFLAPTGYKPSEHFRGTAASVTVIGEAIITGDSKGLDNFHKKSKQGDYGVVMQASSEAGDYWAKHGVAGGLSLFWEALTD